MNDRPVIRSAHESDLPQLVDLLNHYVRTDHCVFDTEEWTVETRKPWWDQFAKDGRHRLLVADGPDGILGYASSTRWRPKAAYDVTVETTVYVSPFTIGQGLGTRLLARLIVELEGTGVHRAVAGVAQPNDISNRLHRSLGFTEVGTFEEVGYKFGNYWSVTWFQREIASTP